MRHSSILSRLTRLILTSGILFVLVFSFVTRAVIAQADVLLDEPFNDNSNNWTLASTANGSMNVGDGALTVEVKKENAVEWVTPEMTFPDDLTVQVEVTTPEPSTAGDWNAGLILRADTRDTHSAFYQFDVDAQGVWTITTRTADGKEYKEQRSGNLDKWDPAASNVLKVVASGTTFAYFVNDRQVGELDDDTINNDPASPKYVGLIAGTFKGVSAIKVEFRSLQITGAGSQEPTATKAPTKAPVRRTPTKAPTKVPTRVKASPTPTEQSFAPGDTLLSDTFPDDNPNGWHTGKGQASNVTVANDSLVIEISKAGYIRWSIPDTASLPADVDITVTVKPLNTPSSTGWSYGIGIRNYEENSDEFMYLFEVLGTSKWAFSTFDSTNGAKDLISPTTIKSGIFKPRAANTLRVTAVGSHFTFYVNDQQVGEADDETLTPPETSRLALFANTDKVALLRVAFSDLNVVAPTP